MDIEGLVEVVVQVVADQELGGGGRTLHQGETSILRLFNLDYEITSHNLSSHRSSVLSFISINISISASISNRGEKVSAPFQLLEYQMVWREGQICYSREIGLCALPAVTLCRGLLRTAALSSGVHQEKKYHRRWRQHRAITVDTVDTVDNIDTVDTV